MEVEVNNMELWEQVCKTDPEYTKEVNMRGGFTAIDPQYQLKRATEQWGPYGGKWGLSSMKFTFIEPLNTMMLEAILYYPHPMGAVAGGDAEIFIAVDMVIKPNDDCCKKLITSARSKALSYLGFSADVYLGKFDDTEYVKDMKVAFAESEQLEKRVLGDISNCHSEPALDKVEKRIQDLRNTDNITAAQHRIFMKAIKEQREQCM